MSKIKSTRTSINMKMDMDGAISHLAGQNIGAMSMLYNFPYRSANDAIMIWCGIDDLNIRDEQIWVAYKYWRADDLDTDETRNERFREAVVMRDQDTLTDLAAFINEQCPCGRGEEAMVVRASFRRSR